jgi:hypothetical protein
VTDRPVRTTGAILILALAVLTELVFVVSSLGSDVEVIGVHLPTVLVAFINAVSLLVLGYLAGLRHGRRNRKIFY